MGLYYILYYVLTEKETGDLDLIKSREVND